MCDGRESVRGPRREEILHRVDTCDDLIHLLQMLSGYVTNGEVVGDRRRDVIRISVGRPVDGVVVSGLEQFLEPVRRVNQVRKSKRDSYVDVGSSSGEVSDFVEHHLMGQARRKTD